MSWDLLIQKPKAGTLPVAQLSEQTEMVPLGDAQQVRDAVSRLLPAVDWRDPELGYYHGDGFSIEFAHRRAGIAEDLMLHVRGGGNPLPTIARLCKTNGWVAYDAGADAYLDLDQPSAKAFEDFKGFRDSALEQEAWPLEPERPPFPLLIGGSIVVAIVGLVLWRKHRMQH